MKKALAEPEWKDYSRAAIAEKGLYLNYPFISIKS
jgi:hypothetical protein